jgi:hypothetical protein
MLHDPILSLVVRWTLVTPREVAAVLGCDIEQASDRLDVLVDEGWLAFWPVEEVGRPPAVTLTPWAAERLGVVLDNDSRWIAADQPRRTLRVDRRRRFLTETDHDAASGRSSLAKHVDPREPEPWIHATVAEETAYWHSRGVYRGDHGRDRLPFPTVLLGLSISWDGPEITATRRHCRSCGGRRLKAHEYCLKCDNWGLERLLPMKPRTRSERARKWPGALRGGLGDYRSRRHGAPGSCQA